MPARPTRFCRYRIGPFRIQLDGENHERQERKHHEQEDQRHEHRKRAPHDVETRAEAEPIGKNQPARDKAGPLRCARKSSPATRSLLRCARRSAATAAILRPERFRAGPAWPRSRAARAGYWSLPSDVRPPTRASARLLRYRSSQSRPHPVPCAAASPAPAAVRVRRFPERRLSPA